MNHTSTFLLLMVTGTFFLGIYDVLTRKILQKNIREGYLLGITHTSSGLILTIISLVKGWPIIQAGFWPAFITTVVLNSCAQFIWYKAFKREEASLISPLRLLTPPLVLFSGFLVLKETPSVWGVLGVLTTIFGLWFLVVSEAHFTGTKFKEVIKRPGVIFGLIGATSFAISFPFDKQAVTHSSALFFSGLAFLAVGLINLFFALIKNRGRDFLSEIKTIKKYLPWFVMVHAVGGYLTFAALNYVLAAYAASAKRLWSLWAVILSGHLLEEKNIRKKLLATLIMILGIVITVFWG